MWICPSCQLPLHLNERRWQCENKHTYDVAKEGYVNLLLAQHKRSKDPGDNKDMINARRTFLDAGHYEPLARCVADIISDQLPGESIRLFDAGCGEGYYLNKVSDLLGEKGKQIDAFGCDVSKVAIQKAAKRYKSAHFAVASTFNLPCESASTDVVFQIFAPSSAQEIGRLLTDSGIWITVDPAANHLKELKQLVYDKQTQHEDKISEQPGFNLISHETLSIFLSVVHARRATCVVKNDAFLLDCDGAEAAAGG